MHYLILFFILFGEYFPVYGAVAKDNKGTVLEGSSGVSIERLEKSDSIDPFAWSNISMTAKPGVFWWWLGSSVNETEIERQLIMLRNAGFGGVLICPIYETKEPVIAPIPYLSERWIEVFRFTLVKAKQLGMFVDVTFGGGWPAGGPWIRKENGERVFRQKELRLNVTPDKPVELMNEEGKDPIVCVTVLAKNNKTLDPYNNYLPASIVEPVIKNGKTVWKLPAVGSCRVVVTRMGYEDLEVYVAHKGGKGRVMDYWSAAAFRNMIEAQDTMVLKLGDLRPRAYFVDSFEGWGSTTPGIFEAFEKINGYDLRPYLHKLTNSKATGTPENIRLWHDYRQTMAALHVQFVERFTKWATEHGSTTRYQYPGDPANPLNTAGAAGIPEDYPPINTSAAHIFGKKLTTREAFTWGAGHNFKDYMDFYRKWADADLMEGLNHIFYHGTPFTPLAEPWPGPMYYAGGNFSEKMPFFKQISAMNDYFSRLQSTLQESEPETDVLMLWSVQDFWNKPPFKFVWRNTDNISSDDDLQRKLRRKLVGRGIQTDLSSEEILMEKAEVVDGNIKCGEVVYKALVIAETKMVSNGTLKKIEQLVRDGGLIIFIKHIPVEAPVGLPLVQNRSESTKALVKMTEEIKGNSTRLHMAPNLEALLDVMKRNGISEDGLLGNMKGRPAHYPDDERWDGYNYSNILGKLSTYRVNLEDRTTYLVRNNTGERMDVWVPLIHLDASSSKVVIGIPRTGEIFLGEHRSNDSGGKKVHLVLEPTELMTVTTVPDQEITDGINLMSYGQKTTLKNIGDSWHISWADYEGNKHQFTTDTLMSWIDYPQLGLFSGIVHYETSFKLNKTDLKNRVLLDVGLIHESAEVVVNGVKTGYVWTTPFEIDISGHLKEGTNTLVLKVANKAQNRIIDMHRKKIHWQKSKLEEVNDARTSSNLLKVESLKPMPSGLSGPVKLFKTD